MATKSNVLTPNKALGKAVAKKRKTLKLSMREFAENAQIPDFTLIGRLERGQDIRHSAVAKICRTFGINPQEFI